MAHLLIIDDDPDLLPDKVCHIFPAPAHRVEVAYTGAEGLRRIAVALPDVILLDLRLPDQSGLDVLRSIRQIDARIPVVFVTLARSAEAAIEAMKQGAYDYLLKPLDMQKLDRVLGEALKVARLMREPAVVAETPPDNDLPGEAIVGCCPAMQEVYKAIGRVADQTFPVLITGESGTGKELVARAIYQHGPRAKAPFLALNCAAIPEQLLESELFGHEKGAFTGADRRRIGKFEQCHGGTIFLDEIGDMPLMTAGEDPPTAPGAGVRTRRRQRDHPDRRTAHRRHPPRPEGVVCRREVSARPLLSRRRVHHPLAAATGAGRRPEAPRAVLFAMLQPGTRSRGSPGCPGDTRRAFRVTLGPGTSESCRTF